MRRIFHGLVVVVILAGCAPSYFVNHEYDKFEGFARDTMGPAWLIGKGEAFPNTALYPVRMQDKDGKVTYYLKLVYTGSGWVFIEDGESLKLLIEGKKKINLQGKGSTGKRDVVSGSVVYEEAWYPVTTDQLKEISNAAFIEIKIVGSRGYLLKEFGIETQINYRKFVADCRI